EQRLHAAGWLHHSALRAVLGVVRLLICESVNRNANRPRKGPVFFSQRVKSTGMTTAEIERLSTIAERAAQAGNWADSRAAYQQVLTLDPAHADAMLQLSYLESFSGHYRAARDWALRAAATQVPARPEAMVELVRRLRTFNEVMVLRD